MGADSVRGSKPSDRSHLDPAEEIEVTLEMIEDGFAVLKAAALTDDLLEADRLTVADIYRAMARRWLASRQGD